MIILPETIKAGVNEILIEKNIPIPTDNKLYFFGTMRIGDSSFVKGDYSIQRSILSGARRYYPKKFTTRQVVENKISGYIYWRTI